MNVEKILEKANKKVENLNASVLDNAVHLKMSKEVDPKLRLKIFVIIMLVILGLIIGFYFGYKSGLANCICKECIEFL